LNLFEELSLVVLLRENGERRRRWTRKARAPEYNEVAEEESKSSFVLVL
jgi:hypothetical protein